MEVKVTRHISRASPSPKPAMKKSQSLEYKRTLSKERVVTNIWDVPQAAAKKVLADQQQQKVTDKLKKVAKRVVEDASKSEKREGVTTTLDSNKKALKQVLHRKEQLESILSHLNKGQKKLKPVSSSNKRVKKAKKQPKILPPYLPSLPNNDLLPPAAVASPLTVPIKEDSHQLLDFQKLFRDIPSSIELERTIAKPEQAPATESSTQPQPIKELDLAEKIEKVEIPSTTITGDIYAVPESVKEIENIESSPSKTQIVQNHNGEVEETHKKLLLLEQSLSKFPALMRKFYSIVPKTKEDGGLSVTDQGRVIHFGIKLETKILELIDQYNSFIGDIEEVVAEAANTTSIL